MTKKVTIFYERYLRVFYPSAEWSSQGFCPETIPERTLLDIPCNDMQKEEAEIIKQKIIEEEKSKDVHYMFQYPDDIKFCFYWREMKTETEYITKTIELKGADKK